MWFYVVLEAVFWVLAIMGFVELVVRLSSLFFVYGKSPVNDVSVFVSVSGGQERLEYILRSLQSNLEGLYTKQGGADIYLVDQGMDRETFLIASSLCTDYDNVYLCRGEEIKKIVEEKNAQLWYDEGNALK